MQERMDNLYDRISDAEDAIEDVNNKITAAYGNHITSQQLYRLLEHFDRVYDKMTDLEKKEFFQNFIDYIEIYPDKKANERILKRIHFRFPVYYKGQSGDTMWLRAENGVETVCLLSKLSEVKNHISVKVDMNEMDLTAAESKATYQEIKEWVKEKYGFHVSHLNIAKTKRKCGIIERQNYNLPKSEDSRSPETPKEKEEAIIAAFKAFRMI
jgi:uncharacterized coiled-coil protein SlyX/ribosomal protein L23